MSAPSSCRSTATPRASGCGSIMTRGAVGSNAGTRPSARANLAQANSYRYDP